VHPCAENDIPPGVRAAPAGGFARPGGQAGVAQAGQELQCHWSPEQHQMTLHDLLPVLREEWGPHSGITGSGLPAARASSEIKGRQA
jgi:hypothetical protein